MIIQTKSLSCRRHLYADLSLMIHACIAYKPLVACGDNLLKEDFSNC